jgi:signal transduction histidine kinase
MPSVYAIASREPVMVELFVVLISVGCGVAVYWRHPELRSYARRVIPFLLAVSGALGLALTLSSSSFAGLNPGGRLESWRHALELQSGAFLAAGLLLIWLIWGARGTLLALINRAGQRRWSWLLPPTVVVLVVLLDHRGASGTTGTVVPVAAVVTLTVMILLPAVAADLAAAGLIVLGIAGLAFVTWPPPVFLPAVQAAPSAGGGFVSTFSAVGTVSGSVELLAAAQGAAILAFGLWLMQRTIGVHARALLGPGPDPQLVGRVERLTQARAEAVDSAAAELRRVERDLHDGAQARLVALGMNLRAAERLIHTSPQAAVALVAEAREASSLALTELRDLVRGIYPPVLADRGLGDAVRALALDTPIRTQTDIDLPGRLDFPVEAACYFAVAEVLANAVKHSGARLVQIRMRHSAGPCPAGPSGPGSLRIEITDDGTGGADPATGTGLAGIERRLGTFDGIVAVSSPPGGPTMIIMEVPCALSSPRTSSC